MTEARCIAQVDSKLYNRGTWCRVVLEHGVVHRKGQILPQQGKTKLIRQHAKHTQHAASFLLLYIPTKRRDCIIRRNTGQHKCRSMCHSIRESRACACANSNMGSRLGTSGQYQCTKCNALFTRRNSRDHHQKFCKGTAEITSQVLNGRYAVQL